MAYTRTTITEAELAFYEGSGVSVSITADAHELFVANGEVYLCSLLKYDIVTNWASLNPVYKLIFTEFIGRLAAISAISYNMAGYATIYDAEDLINIHAWRIIQIEKLLKKSAIQDFLGV